MKIADILGINEETVGPGLLSSTDAVPDLPSANRMKDQHVVRRNLNRRPRPTPLLGINELFDVRAPVRQINQNEYTFSVDGKPFMLEFSPNGPTSVEVVLSRRNPNIDQSPLDLLNDFGKNPIVVYSTMIAIIAKYLKTYQPNVCFFYGFTPEQQRVYLKMFDYAIRKGQIVGYSIHTSGGAGAFVRDGVLIAESEFGPTQDEYNKIAHDEMARAGRKRIRKAKFVAMPGNTSTYPAL